MIGAKFDLSQISIYTPFPGGPVFERMVTPATDAFVIIRNNTFRRRPMKPSNVRSLMLFCFLIAIALSTQGCTKMMWKTTLMEDVYIESFMRFSTTENIDSRKSSYLFASYGREYGGFDVQNYIYAIPLNDGHVPGLFEYRGEKKTAPDIINDLPPERLNRIKYYRFLKNAYGNNGSKYNHEQLSFEMRIVTDDAKIFDPSHKNNYPDNVAYAVIQFSGDSTASLRSRTIILPARQTFSSTERTGQIMLATLFSPITIAADVLFFPIVLLVRPSGIRDFF